MKMQEKLKGKNGITLIALVVTIIVLIILAGVSISLILGDNGIVEKTKFAKENMQVAANEEQDSLANLAVAIENEGGAGGGSSTPQISINDLKAGDYIKYDTGVTSVGENGLITCRVLYEASSVYGLQIISDKNVGLSVTLGGGDNWEEAKTSYNNAIETLNREAGKYLNTTYAVDARCVGSIPTVDRSGTFTEKNKGTETTVTLPPPVPEGEDSSDWWTGYTRPRDWTSDDTGCYDTDTNYTTDEVQMTKPNVNILQTNQNYWMASRLVTTDNIECAFRMRFVYYDEDLETSSVNGRALCYVYNDSIYSDVSSPYSGIRPCFSLKSDIKITGGDGKEEATAYTIRYLEDKI